MNTDIFTTNGRMRRTHYIVFGLLIGLALGVADILLSLFLGHRLGHAATIPLRLASIWPSYCIAVQRAHDMGKGQGFVLTIFATSMLGIIVLATGGVLAKTGSIVGLPLIGIGLISLIAGAVLSLILVFAGPDEQDTWGPNPR